jgi:hypothetical protein
MKKLNPTKAWALVSKEGDLAGFYGSVLIYFTRLDAKHAIERTKLLGVYHIERVLITGIDKVEK